VDSSRRTSLRRGPRRGNSTRKPASPWGRTACASADPGRDPRGWTVSVVFIADLGDEGAEVDAGDDAGEARWWTLPALPTLAFDHDQVVADALRTHAARA